MYSHVSISIVFWNWTRENNNEKYYNIVLVWFPLCRSEYKVKFKVLAQGLKQFRFIGQEEQEEFGCMTVVMVSQWLYFNTSLVLEPDRVSCIDDGNLYVE